MASIQPTNIQGLQLIESEIANFNKALEEHPILSDDLINRISKVVEDEMVRLSTYSVASRAFEEAITDKRWCSRSVCCSPISKQVWLLFVGNLIGNILLFTVSALGDKEPSTDRGIAIGTSGILFNAASLAYGFKVSSNIESAKKLKKLNENALENANKFHTCLKKWKESEKRAKEILTRVQEEQRQLTIPKEHVVVHVDIADLHKSIGECLQAYDRLSTEHRTDQAFVRLASHLTSQLPEEDELRKELRKIEPLRDVPEDIAAGRPLPYQYYGSSSIRRMSRLAGEQASSSSQDLKEETTPLVSQDASDIRDEFAKEVSNARNKITEKYGLKNFPYYLEVGGWQVDKNGIRKARPSVGERKESARPSVLDSLPESPISLSGRLSSVSPPISHLAPLNTESIVSATAPKTPGTPRLLKTTTPSASSVKAAPSSPVPNQDTVTPISGIQLTEVPLDDVETPPLPV